MLTIAVSSSLSHSQRHANNHTPVQTVLVHGKAILTRLLTHMHLTRTGSEVILIERGLVYQQTHICFRKTDIGLLGKY